MPSEPPRVLQIIGALHYSVASYNGHMHGRCETEGCVAWMQ